MTTTSLWRRSWSVALCGACTCATLACNTTRDPNAGSTPGTGIANHGQPAGSGTRAAVEPGRLPVGPYKFIELASGEKAPWYLLPFDKFAPARLLSPAPE